jgi:hypothetical protein
MHKVTRNKKPVKRYVKKKDAIGRVYTLDRKTGKRASRTLWEREQKKIARQYTPKNKRVPTKRVKISEQVQRIERAKRAAQTRRRNQKLREKEARIRSERAIRGWDTRRERQAIVEERITPTKWQEQFTPLGTEFGISLREKCRRYPKVLGATLDALAYAATEYRKITPKIMDGSYTPTADEWIRAQLMSAHIGNNAEFTNFEQAAAAMSEQFDKTVKEVYQLFFSPDVA